MHAIFTRRSAQDPVLSDPRYKTKPLRTASCGRIPARLVLAAGMGTLSFGFTFSGFWLAGVGPKQRRPPAPARSSCEQVVQERSSVNAGCMFQLATIQDTAVKIVPENLGLPRLEALTQRIESTYVDKARSVCASQSRARLCRAQQTADGDNPAHAAGHRERGPVRHAVRDC